MMELPVIGDAYEEFEKIRESGVINMFARQGVQAIAADWFGLDCALALLTAVDYYSLLRTYSDWQAQKEVI